MPSKKTPNPIDIHVGTRVRMRRMMLGMSQEKLGEGLDITFQQIQKYEKGSNRIGASRLQHIATILQVPISFFFEGAPETPQAAATVPVPNTQQMLAAPLAMEMLSAFNNLESHDLKRSFVSTVRAAGPKAEEPMMVAAE